MQEAGATADLELGYTLADGLEYARAGQKAGLDIDSFAPRLSFFWAIGMNFFMEVAKMRAGRMLWAKIMRRAGREGRQVACPARPLPDLGLEPDRAGRFQQRHPHLRRGDGRHPWRHAVAAHQRARRGAGPADRFLRAHRPQHPAFPAQETGTTRVIDPWGGSYYVERLTHELAEKAWAHIEEVEALGGMAKAIDAGLPKMRIEEAAARTQARIDSGAQTIVGVNRYKPEAEKPVDVLVVDNSAVRAMQIEKLKRLRAERKRGRDASRARRAHRSGGRAGRAICSICRSRRRGRRPRSARCRTHGEGVRPPRVDTRAVSGVYRQEIGQMNDTVRRALTMTAAFEAARRPPPADPGRQDRPGRP